MGLVEEYQQARTAEDVARLRRLIALRAMQDLGMSQRDIACALGVSQPAVSQQLRAGRSLAGVHPEILLAAAAPVIKSLAADLGFSRLAVFGSVARHQADTASDIDLLVESPPGASSFDLVRLQQRLERVLERRVDLVDYGGLQPVRDRDIEREAVLL